MGISILQPDPDLCLYPDHGEYPNLDTVLDFDPKVYEQELESVGASPVHDFWLILILVLTQIMILILILICILILNHMKRR